jgi:hypothetical protein
VECRLPYIIANIAKSSLNESLTNGSGTTNTAKLAGLDETMARTPERLRAERLQIMLDGEELVAVDDFRFRKRMPSRAAAVRELLKRGLAAEGFLSAAAGAKSSDYGVIGKTPAGRQ